MTPEEQRDLDVHSSAISLFDLACMDDEFDTLPEPVGDFTEADYRRNNDRRAKAMGFADIQDLLHVRLRELFDKGFFDGSDGDERLRLLASVLDRDYPVYLMPLMAESGLLETLEGQERFVAHVARKIGAVRSRRASPASPAVEQIAFSFRASA
jgi:hypothetical protein